MIVEATIGLIGEVGWAAVTTRAVAARAGVTQGVIHYHFGSKDALLRAAMISATEALLEGPTRQVMQASDLRSGLVGLVTELGSIEAASPLMLVSSEALALALRDPELGAWMRDELAAFRPALAGLLRDSARRGQARGDLDPDQTAVVLAALLDGLLFHKAVDPALDLEAAASALSTMLAPAPDPSRPSNPSRTSNPSGPSHSPAPSDRRKKRP